MCFRLNLLCDWLCECCLFIWFTDPWVVHFDCFVFDVCGGLVGLVSCCLLNLWCVMCLLVLSFELIWWCFRLNVLVFIFVGFTCYLILFVFVLKLFWVAGWTCYGFAVVCLSCLLRLRVYDWLLAVTFRLVLIGWFVGCLMYCLLWGIVFVGLFVGLGF